MSRSTRSRFPLTILLATLFALTTPITTRGQVADVSTATTLVVNADATFLRDAPNVRGRVVERLERGDRVEVLDRTAGDWWRVRAGDPPREGYVHRLVLAPPRSTPPREVPQDLPPPAPVTEPPAEDTQEPDDTRAASRVGVLAAGGVGLFFPTARDTFDAVGITGNPVTYTGSVEVVRVFRSLFVRGSFDWTSETGERVFLTESGERFPLGIPLDVELLPIEFGAGWRFEGDAARKARLVPYVGGGAGLLRYRETDPFAEDDEEVDERFTTYHVFAGVDVYFHRWIGARAEYRFRHVPGALGEGGVSAITGDTSLGGSLFFVGVVVGR